MSESNELGKTDTRRLSLLYLTNHYSTGELQVYRLALTNLFSISRHPTILAAMRHVLVAENLKRDGKRP